MAAPNDPESGGTPRRVREAALRLADAEEPQTASGGQSRSDLSQMIDELRAQVDEEYRIMERLDAKARQAFAFVAALFAIVQTVAFDAFAEAGTGGRIILALLAAAAAVSLLVLGHHLRNEEELQVQRVLDPDKILGWWEEATGENYVAVRLARGLAVQANERADNNDKKAQLYKSLDNWARLSLILTSLELLGAIAIHTL